MAPLGLSLSVNAMPRFRADRDDGENVTRQASALRAGGRSNGAIALKKSAAVAPAITAALFLRLLLMSPTPAAAAHPTAVLETPHGLTGAFVSAPLWTGATAGFDGHMKRQQDASVLDRRMREEIADAFAKARAAQLRGAANLAAAPAAPSAASSEMPASQFSGAPDRPQRYQVPAAAAAVFGSQYLPPPPAPPPSRAASATAVPPPAGAPPYGSPFPQVVYPPQRTAGEPQANWTSLQSQGAGFWGPTAGSPPAAPLSPAARPTPFLPAPPAVPPFSPIPPPPPPPAELPAAVDISVKIPREYRVPQTAAERFLPKSLHRYLPADTPFDPDEPPSRALALSERVAALAAKRLERLAGEAGAEGLPPRLAGIAADDPAAKLAESVHADFVSTDASSDRSSDGSGVSSGLRGGRPGDRSTSAPEDLLGSVLDAGKAAAPTLLSLILPRVSMPNPMKAMSTETGFAGNWGGFGWDSSKRQMKGGAGALGFGVSNSVNMKDGIIDAATSWQDLVATAYTNPQLEEISAGVKKGQYGVTLDRQNSNEATAFQLLTRFSGVSGLADLKDRDYGARLKVRDFNAVVRHDFDEFLDPQSGEFATEVLFSVGDVGAAISTDVGDALYAVTVAVKGLQMSALRDFDERRTELTLDAPGGFHAEAKAKFIDGTSDEVHVKFGLGRKGLLYLAAGAGISAAGMPKADAAVELPDAKIGFALADKAGDPVGIYSLDVGGLKWSGNLTLDPKKLLVPGLLGILPGDLGNLLLGGKLRAKLA